MAGWCWADGCTATSCRSSGDSRWAGSGRFQDSTSGSIQPGTVDVSQCSDGGAPPPGNPAQCERVALAQLEYRNELHSSFFDFLNSRPIRLRGIGFTVQPTAVAFVDAGRGWLVGPAVGHAAVLQPQLPAIRDFQDRRRARTRSRDLRSVRRQGGVEPEGARERVSPGAPPVLVMPKLRLLLAAGLLSASTLRRAEKSARRSAAAAAERVGG